MKKTLLILAASALIAGPALAQGDNISTTAMRRNTLPPVSREQSEGALQRGFRLGNPLEMLNPLAPARYGRGTDFTVERQYHDQTLRPRDRSRTYISGVRLLSFTF
ncbi:MAG TPA: hypothetical protein VHY22_15785 [Chthoniobacteraceae bacterium]|jgi:hypothetical protein|nr:hypothetical protein [Chthoniobacteraceae bacterium]